MPKRRVHILVGLSLIVATAGCGSSSPPPASPEPAPAPAAAQPGAATPAAPTTADTAPTQTGTESSAETTKPTEAAPTEPEPEPGSPMQTRMRAHFKEAGLIRAAVIGGRPNEAVAAAEALANMDEVARLPESWREPIQRMQASAKRVKDSYAVAQAAAATADIGTSCGLCHQKLGGPKAKPTPPPEVTDSLVGRMARHAWATERLWEGLYVPSNQAWTAGAAVLETTPFPAEILTRGGVHARSAAKDFGNLVVKAPSQKTASDRAALYAQLLETCGACHLAVGKGGGR